MENFIINENDWVIVKKQCNLKAFQVKAGRQVWFEKLKFKFDGAIGHPYGSQFKICRGTLEKHSIQETEQISHETQDDIGDNRHLIDCESNQKLSNTEIQTMQQKGIDGKEIIEKLIENSETFENKTEYSKQKYINKKKQKFTAVISINKPTLRQLCVMHFNKSKPKICYMRLDCLAQILTQANIRSGANVMVVESCAGMVLGSVLQRLGDSGKIIDFHNGTTRTRVMEGLPFTKEFINKHVLSLSLQHVETLNLGKMLPDTTPVHNMEEYSNIECDHTMPNEKETDNLSCVGDKDKSLKRKLTQDELETIVDRKQKRIEQINSTMEFIRSNPMDSLIVATKFDPTPIVLKLLQFLKPSRPIAVYCQFKEPLMQCFMKLKEIGGVVFLRLSETWLREYQILPQRTHPEINMSGGSGYLLTGITVLND